MTKSFTDTFSPTVACQPGTPLVSYTGYNQWAWHGTEAITATNLMGVKLGVQGLCTVKLLLAGRLTVVPEVVHSMKKAENSCAAMYGKMGRSR